MQYFERETLFKQLCENAKRQYIPLSGIFELTPRCTLDCKMCYVHLTESQMNGKKELTGDQWIEIIDQAIDNGMLFALLTGGECLLHKDFKKIYLHLRERGIIISVNTNGTILNDELLDFFKKNPPNRFKITLYGISEDGYERVTGHRQFTRVRDNILKLKNAGFSVKLAVTVCKYIYDETIEIVKFAKEHQLPYSIDMAMQQANEETGRDVSDYDLTGEQIAQKYREIAMLGGKEVTPCDDCDLELPKRMEGGEIAKCLICGAGRQQFSVSWDGKMYPCLWLRDEPQEVLEKGFVASWKECNRIVDDYVVPMECNYCEYFAACTTCTVKRADPNDPAHCNPAVCAGAIAKIKAGVSKKNKVIGKIENIEDICF